jgi:hypothetical protein
MTTVTRRTGRPADDAIARRAEIFRQARPLLEEFGFREVTVTAAANGLVVDRFFLQEDAAGYTAAAQALQTGLPAK